MRRTKIVCTIGPKTASYENLEKLASLGMNVARLNMSHGDHEWHRKIIQAIKTINSKAVYSIAILLDTKGPEIRTGDLTKAIVLSKGDEFAFTVRRQPKYGDRCTEVNYDGFINDVSVGDILLIDGGMISFKVKNKTGTDAVCECLEGGVLTSRRHLNIKGKSSRMPQLSPKDWEDIDFGISERIDFIAVSFVKNSGVIIKLKKYLSSKNAPIDVIAKIENAQALPNLTQIITEADGVMVARGDLGAEIPLEDIPLVQEDIVMMAAKLGKPTIIATHLLESMIENPTPTRAEVTDIAEAIKERADAIMLSGETATGNYPFKSVNIMDTVASRIELKIRENKKIRIEETEDPKIEMSRGASIMANNINSKAILVFTRRGYMAALISRCRPNPPIFAFTNMTSVRRRLNLYWGISPFRIEFSKDPEKTIQRAIEVLRTKKLLKKRDEVIIVSDILAGKEFVETIQIRKIN